MGKCNSKHASDAVDPSNHNRTEKEKFLDPSTGKGYNDVKAHANQNPAVVPPTQAKSDTTSKSGVSSTPSYTPGYSSGASTPPIMDISTHSKGGGDNPKTLGHSSSVLGLDTLINDRKAEGDLKNNIVHMEVPFGKPIEEVYDGIHDGPVLGSGISGLVRLCVHKATSVKYAVKCLDLDLVETDEGLQQLREEIAIMCQLDHPNIVRLEEVYESHSEIYLVQELCVGGELFDRLDEQPDYHYTESQCARLVKQMLCSVRYIHSKGIIHRDLKLENFLFSTNSPDSELKMIDFGLSKHFKYGEVQHEAVGTPYTVAPEVIRGSYEERCDVWAIGVITYLLLSGDPPFGGCGGPESLMQVRSNILAGRFQFEPREIWDHVSHEAKDFIRMLLVTDPTNRPTARQCQKSAWLHEWANKERKEGDNLLNKDVVQALVNFKEYSDMRKLLCEVLSFTLLPNQITDLRREFEKLDIDGSGEISLKGLKKVLMEGARSGTVGALTEEEIEDIFNAMRVRKTETRIHWHEFIAAGLSQCKVDERNLRLAFDRLDADHKGFVTFDNIMDMMGKDGAESEDEMRDMWANSMKACKCKEAHVTYKDFLLLMKGQTMQGKEHAFPHPQRLQAPQPTAVRKSFLPMAGADLAVLDEISDETEDEADALEDLTPILSVAKDRRDFLMPMKSLPSIHSRESYEDFPMDAPISMDGEDEDEMLSRNADHKMQMKINLTPPQSPVRSPVDFVTPTGERFTLSPNLSLSEKLPPLPDSSDFSRRRSKSVDDQDEYVCDDIVPDTRRAVLLPEHTHGAREIETAIKDDKLTPLVINRKLYRAHRQMRLAVLEASKRFEEQQLQRTKAEWQKRQDDESSRHFGAGLVMRRGHKKELSTDAIRKIMTEKQKAHQSIVETAARRGGRGKRARKKTVSDMSGMLLSIPSAEQEAASVAETSVSKSVIISSVPELPEPEFKLHDIAKPEPTVPGVFRKTQDPFRPMSTTMRNVLEQDIDFSNSGEGKEIHENNKIGQKVLRSSSSNLKASASDGELQLMTPDSP